MTASSLSLRSDPGSMAITLLDSNGLILLTMCAFSLNGNVTGLKSRDCASAIILSRSMPAEETNFCATGNWIHEATFSLGWPSRRKYDFSPELELRREGQRSEEHTSELQSLAYLVCRLL